MAFPLCTVALAFALGAGHCQEHAPDTSSGGALFGWAWGTSRETIERHQHLEPLPTADTSVRMYRTDLPSFGDAMLRDCDFEFVHDTFAGIVITTHGKANSRALLRELQKLYGPGQQEDPRGFGWLTSATHAHYDEDSAGDAYVYIYAVRIYSPPGARTPARSH